MKDLEKKLDVEIEEIVYLLSDGEIHPLTAKKLIIRKITELKILNIPVVSGSASTDFNKLRKKFMQEVHKRGV